MSDSDDMTSEPVARAGGESAGTTTPRPATASTGGLRASPAFKFFAVAFLVGLLTVPILFVWMLTDERNSRRDQVLSQIDRDWGGTQLLRGPYIAVPVVYRAETVLNGRTRETEETRTVVVFPDVLDALVDTKTQLRSVSIFETPVFNADVRLTGRFPVVALSSLGGDARQIRWEDARIVLELSDLGGVEDAAMSVGSNVTLPMQPGAAPGTLFPQSSSPPSRVAHALSLEPGAGIPVGDDSVTAISAAIGLASNVAPSSEGLDFDVALHLRGRDSLDLVPTGRETTASLSSDWPHPSFVGRILPSSHSLAGEDLPPGGAEPRLTAGSDAAKSGFSATWRVPYLSRTTPQVVTDMYRMSSLRYSEERVGVRFDDPVDFYALVERALKYGVMFVAAVYGIVFVLEILSTRRIHVVQYVLVGLIVVFFYVLLLALAEHVGFAAAYTTAAGATSAVIATFVGLALSSRARGAFAGGGLAGLFVLLYAILRLEDVALLGGAVAGFVALTAVLFATRRVNWSGQAEPETATPAKAA